MKPQIIPKIKQYAPIVVIMIILVAAIIYIVIAKKENGSLTASGTIETAEVVVSSELGGLVSEVLVHEGDNVKKGESLIIFDDALLKVQYQQAQAALFQAEANYTQLTAKSQVDITSAQQALDLLYTTEDIDRTAAEQTYANVLQDVDDAQYFLDNLLYGSKQSDIDQAFANMILARDRLEEAQEDFDKWAGKPETNVTRAQYLSILGQRRSEYDHAVTLYYNLIAEANTVDLTKAQADLSNSQARLIKAEEDLKLLSDGPDPDALSLIKAQLAAAESGIDVAEAQIQVAEANLDSIEVKLNKLVITAPMDAIVMYRSIEPGEVSQPGASLITLARLDDLTITVFIQEDRYGLLSIGDSAKLTVDSYPDIYFSARIVRISDQAEFTPRNVQTAEGRRSTVFAIKLSVDDPSGRLKPGMPADVSFFE